MRSPARLPARAYAAPTDPQRADWIEALAAEVSRTNQARTAERLGIAESTVSQVLSGSYAAQTTRIERRVRGELLGATCDCPVMGEVSTTLCQAVQERRQPIHNPQHARAWMACRGMGPFTRVGVCPHYAAAAKPAVAGQPTPSIDPQEA
jgi:predicted alpha/beta hydrolase family esterase